MDRDPAKARAWEQRSRAAALERQKAKASGGLKRSGNLRARSPRKADRYAAIAKACGEAIARDGHRCQARLLVPEVRCGGKLDPQHVIPQGIDKTLAAEPRNIVACCRRHHEWIEAEKIQARALGLHGHYGDALEELADRRRTGALAPGS